MLDKRKWICVKLIKVNSGPQKGETFIEDEIFRKQIHQ